MVEEGATSRTAAAILTEPFGILRLARALVPVWYAILVRSKDFFGNIDSARGPVLRNALGFLAIALAIYVAIQTILEEVLIRAFQYEGPTFVAYYAYVAGYKEYDWPLADIVAFFMVLGLFAAICAVQVFSFGAGMWIFVRSYVHFGNIASIKSLLAAVAYATSFVILTISIASIPLIALSDHNDPMSLFYFFGPFTASDSLKYQLALTYFYVRAVSFTIGIMLHWGMVFTILIGYAVIFLGSVL